MLLGVSFALLASAGGVRRHSVRNGRVTGNGGSVMRNDPGSVMDPEWDPGSVMDPEFDTTIGGCNCTSECKATRDDLFQRDWCKVHASCRARRWGPFRGNFGYCEYHPIQEFDNQTAEAKEAQIWNKIIENDTAAELPPTWPAILSALDQFAVNNLFDNFRDIKPRGQAKILHAQGLSCKFSMTLSSASPYSGILAPGTTRGIFRIGSATPDPLPGLSIKWLRSHVWSANTMMLRASGIGDFGENFFEEALSNHVPPPGALELVGKFLKATDCHAMLGLSDMCMYDQNGQYAGDHLNFPFELVFEPANRTLATMPPDREDYQTELWKLLKAIPVGTKLFVVKARANPGDTLEEIGEFKTASECTNSLWGDQRLTFKHWRIEDDYRFRPEWVSAVAELCKAAQEELEDRHGGPFVEELEARHGGPFVDRPGI